MNMSGIETWPNPCNLLFIMNLYSFIICGVGEVVTEL